MSGESDEQEEAQALTDVSPPVTENLRVIETLNDGDALPGTEQAYVSRPWNKDKHTANTRRTLAFGALGVLVTFYGGVFVGFWMDVFTMNEVAGLIAAFGGLQTLAAAVFGFFFGKAS